MWEQRKLNDYIQGNSKAYGYATAEVKINPENNDVEVIDPSYVDTTAKENVQNLYYLMEITRIWTKKSQKSVRRHGTK